MEALVEQYKATRQGVRQIHESGDLRVVFGGIEIQDECKPLQHYGMAEGSTVFFHQKLRGGGCDGGTTAQQRKFLRQAHKKKKAS